MANYLDKTGVTKIFELIHDNYALNSVMTGATSSVAGAAGLVPAPAANKHTSFLRGDGTWAVPADTNTKVNVTLGTTTKAYLLGTSTAPTSTTAAVTSIADTGVYLGTTAGSLYATTLYEGGTALSAKYQAKGTYLTAQDHYKTSITSGSFGPSANATLSHSGTFTVPYVTVNADGHVSAIKNITYTLPASGNTDAKVTQTVTTTNAAYPLLLAPKDQTTTTTTTAYFDSGVTLNPSTNILNNAKVYEAYLQWGGTSLSGSISPIDAALDSQFSANRLSFMPADDISVEYSTDSGSTWIDYGLTDSQKQSLVTTGLSQALYMGKKTTGQKPTDKLRVTITATNGKTYFSLKKILIYLSTQGATGTKVLIERSAIGSDTTYTQVGEYSVSGWSGWNSIPYSTSFGGSTSQTSQTRRIRMTFSFVDCSASYIDKTAFQVSKISMHGETSWSNSGGSLASTGHLYSYDINKTAAFPAALKATTLYEGGTALSDKYQAKGTYATSDTKNTAGATNTASKIFLIGATGQSANPQTYSNVSCYASGGYLYSNKTKVSVEGHTHSYAAMDHQHTTNDIISLAEYTIAAELADITTTDTLNGALGKLQYKLNNHAHSNYLSTSSEGTVSNKLKVIDSGTALFVGYNPTGTSAAAITLTNEEGSLYLIGGNINIGKTNSSYASIWNTFAPISHASSATTYGEATTSNYGHVKISNEDCNTVSSANGLAAGMNHTHGNYIASGSTASLSRLQLTTSELINNLESNYVPTVGSIYAYCENTFSKTGHTHTQLPTLTGDLVLSAGNEDRFIKFSYNNGSTYSWRLGYLGSGSGDTNYFVIQSAKAAGTSWNNAIRLGNETLDAAFGGNVYPIEDSSKSLGTSTNAWSSIYGDILYEGGTSLSDKYQVKDDYITSGSNASLTRLQLTTSELISTSGSNYVPTAGSVYTYCENTFSKTGHTHSDYLSTSLGGTVSNKLKVIDSGTALFVGYDPTNTLAAAITLTNEEGSLYLIGGNINIGKTNSSYASIWDTFAAKSHTHAYLSTTDASGLSYATADFTDGTQLVTSYAADTGFGTANYKGLYRRNASSMYNYIKGKLDSVYQAKGTYATSDTKNTAGATNSTSKLYLIGATSQTANPQTYSNVSCYAKEGYLYSDNSKVITEAGGTVNGTLSVINGLIVQSGLIVWDGCDFINSDLKGKTATDDTLSITHWGITTNGTASFYDVNTTSDMRLKNVVSEDIPLSIKQIADAPTIEFKWKRRPNDPSKIGTSAQYWQDIVPATVSTYTEESGQDILTLDYTSLGVVSSIKVARHSLELEEKIKSLQEENDKLKSKLASLESRLAEIEEIIESIL